MRAGRRFVRFYDSVGNSETSSGELMVSAIVQYIQSARYNQKFKIKRPERKNHHFERQYGTAKYIPARYQIHPGAKKLGSADQYLSVEPLYSTIATLLCSQ